MLFKETEHNKLSDDTQLARVNIDFDVRSAAAATSGSMGYGIAGYRRDPIKMSVFVNEVQQETTKNCPYGIHPSWTGYTATGSSGVNRGTIDSSLIAIIDKACLINNALSEFGITIVDNGDNTGTVTKTERIGLKKGGNLRITMYASPSEWWSNGGSNAWMSATSNGDNWFHPFVQVGPRTYNWIYPITKTIADYNMG